MRPECSVEKIVQKSEDVYQALAKQNHRKGNPLQTAANILCMVDERTTKIAKRYSDLRDGFRNNGVSIWQSDYDELAILTFLNHPTSRIVNCVLDHRESMKSLRPRPDRSLTFNLAASTTFLQLAQIDKTMKNISDTKALMDMQAILQAQQAAIAASAAAASSAAAAG